MLRFLFPALLLGAAFFLLGGRLGAVRIPADVAGMPTPMILFIGMTVVILAALRTI